MLIGVPKEIKNHEYRAGLTPSSVRELTSQGHQVIVQKNLGTAIDLSDDQYTAAGATLVVTPEEIFKQADMIVKVKEPQPGECAMLRPGQILFTYLHLAPDPEQAQALQKSGAVAIAYETVTDPRGGLPLLAPMSEVAGRMAVHAGAHFLEKSKGGRGVLIGGVPGVPAANVVILGGGVVGTNALMTAVGMGGNVTVLDRSLSRLKELDFVYGNRIKTLYSTVDAVEKAVMTADLVIGAVLVPGAAAPKLVTKALLKKMQKGAVMVDVAIDQGGCFETSKPTTHQDPIFVVDDIIHYCVANMPGGVARTSTFALNNATLPFTVALAHKGWKKALRDDSHLLNGLNVCEGKITHPAVAEALGTAYTPPIDVLA